MGKINVESRIVGEPNAAQLGYGLHVCAWWIYYIQDLEDQETLYVLIGKRKTFIKRQFMCIFFASIECGYTECGLPPPPLTF